MLLSLLCRSLASRLFSDEDSTQAFAGRTPNVGFSLSPASTLALHASALPAAAAPSSMNLGSFVPTTPGSAPVMAASPAPTTKSAEVPPPPPPLDARIGRAGIVGRTARLEDEEDEEDALANVASVRSRTRTSLESRPAASSSMASASSLPSDGGLGPARISPTTTVTAAGSDRDTTGHGAKARSPVPVGADRAASEEETETETEGDEEDDELAAMAADRPQLRHARDAPDIEVCPAPFSSFHVTFCFI